MYTNIIYVIYIFISYIYFCQFISIPHSFTARPSGAPTPSALTRPQNHRACRAGCRRMARTMRTCPRRCGSLPMFWGLSRCFPEKISEHIYRIYCETLCFTKDIGGTYIYIEWFWTLLLYLWSGWWLGPLGWAAYVKFVLFDSMG